MKQSFRYFKILALTGLILVGLSVETPRQSALQAAGGTAPATARLLVLHKYSYSPDTSTGRITQPTLHAASTAIFKMSLTVDVVEQI